MPSTGFVFCGTSEDHSGLTWNTPGNATSDNGQYAALSWTDQAESEPLHCHNFGFSLPANATIVGIEVRANYTWTQVGTGFDDFICHLTKDGTNSVGALRHWVTQSPTEVTITIGGPTDLWGTTFTKAEVEASTFGAQLTGQAETGDTSFYDIDFVQMNIYYSVPGAAPTALLQTAISSGSRW